MRKQLLPFLLIAFMSIIGANVYAQNSQNKRTIHVETAGTLSSYISDGEKYQIEELTLSGVLNGTDLAFLREMAGRASQFTADTNFGSHIEWAGFKSTGGKLAVIDMSGVNIVSGGVYLTIYEEWGIPNVKEYSVQANEIPFYVFGGCDLTSITIPNSVTSIGVKAFCNCSGLTSIVSQINNPIKISDDVFDSNIYSKAILTVPFGTKTLYESTEGWKKFQNIVEASDLSTQIDYSKQPFTIVPVDKDITVSWIGHKPGDSTAESFKIAYSLDGGQTWTNHEYGDYAENTIKLGEKCIYKSNGNGSNGFRITGTSGAFEVEGNIMSLIYGDDFIGKTSYPYTTYNSWWLSYLFQDNTNLISANNLVLPVTTLPEPERWDGGGHFGCYQGMFQGCTNLLAAPVLPAQTLTEACYKNMFSGCTNLSYIECHATDISATNCTSDWLKDVSPTGTFVKNASTAWTSGASGIPSGWTIEASAPIRRTINVETAGTLPNLISEEDKYQIEELTLTGELNGTDFKFIREMAGDIISFGNSEYGDYIVIHNSTEGILTSLDISNAKIVQGGDDYNYIRNMSHSVSGLSTRDNMVTPGLFTQTNLKSIILPNNITSIEGKEYSYMLFESANPWGDNEEMKESSIGAFPKNITSIIIPSSVTSIGECAFEGCTSLTSVQISDLEAWCNIDFSSNPLSYAHHLYLNGDEIKDLVIPRSVTSINSSAFSGCSSLTSVTIPNSVTSIGSYAFRDCSGLTSVTIPNSVTSICSGAFRGCSGLISVTISNSVTSIDDYTFNGCSGLTSMTIPNSVTSIGSSSFSGCSNLTSINIPNSVTTIGDRTFDKCSKLTTISIPDGVITIGSYAFSGCSGLTSMTIPNSVTSIGRDAFDETTWYNNQPNGLVYAGQVAYKYKGEMPSNTSITLKEGTLGIAGNAFSSCTGLTSVIIPNSVKSIGEWAFSSCSSLNSIVIPNKVTSIGSYSFYSCSALASITIPNSVTSISVSAFSGCSNLTKIISRIMKPFKIDYYLFKAVYSNAELVVPEGTKSLYEATDGWKNFQNIVEALPIKRTIHVETAGTLPNLISEDEKYEIKKLTLTGELNGTDLYFIREMAGDRVTYKGGANDFDIYYYKTNGKLKSIDLSEAVIKSGGSWYDLTLFGSDKEIEYFEDYIHIWLNGEIDFRFTKDNTITESLFISTMESILLPNSVTRIVDRAFAGLSSLTSITIPGSVNTIGGMAFSDCSGLTSIVSKIENPFNINVDVFPSEVYSTATLTVPAGTKTIYQSTDGWKNFQNIVEAPSPKRTIHVATAGTLPDLIGDDKYLIEELTLSGELNGTDFKFIREMAGDEVSYKIQYTPSIIYHNPTKGILASLDISNAKIVKGGEDYNFILDVYSVMGLSTIDNKITPGLFTHTNLKSIILPNSITSIDGKEIRYMVPTGNVYNDVEEVKIGYIGDFSESISSIIIPNSVTSIGDYAFYDCRSLTSISIPNSVTNIGSGVFGGCCDLTTVVIGKGVTSIGNAFSNCNNLNEMTLSQTAYDNSSIPATVTKFTTYSKNPMRVEVVSKGAVSATMKIYPIDEQGNTNENNCYIVTTSGQTPGQYIKWKLDDENYGIISEKTEGTLTMETQQAQPMSTTKARLSAIVNEADDDLHFGFEWLRHNAPDDMVPNKVLAPLYDGHIIGSLSGLNPDIYYKYRSFYKSDSGETIYGNWVTFLTGDANVFFEPEVHTKEATAISNEGAQLSAVWVEGTEDILEKGFEYWPKISGVRSATRATHVTAVIVKGNETSVTLEGLEAGTEYAYRSYMRTVSGTFYGEEMTFKTPLMGDANNDGKVDSNDIDIIAHYIVTGDIKGFNFKNADMNNDQKVNVADIVELNKQIGKK